MGWTDTVIKAVNKNAGSDKEKMGRQLQAASSIDSDWRWMDYIDPKEGTPCLLMEWLTGTRGLLAGRVAKIEALEGVGKTSLCFLFYAMGQKGGHYCWHVESEQAPPTPDYIASYGCDPRNLLIEQPKALNAALSSLDNITNIIRTKEDKDYANLILAGIDSVSGLASDEKQAMEVQDADDTSGLGYHARVLSQWLRNRNQKVLAERRAILLFTAQLKDKINTGFSKAGGDETTIASKPMNYYSTFIFKMGQRKLGEGKERDGDLIWIKTQKNKLSPKHRKIELHLYKNEGFDMMSPTAMWIRQNTPIMLPDGTPFSFDAKGGGYTECPNLGIKVKNNREGYRELMHALYADTDLLMAVRESLRIRGFGFDFETQYGRQFDEPPKPAEKGGDKDVE